MIPTEKTKSRFEELMYYFGLPAACILFALLATMSVPAGLTYSGKMALAVFTCALILWVSESIPTYLTALLVLVLLPITGGWDETNVLGVFGYSVIWLMVSAFIITAGMEKSGIAKRLALWMVSRFGSTARKILFSLMLVNYGLAFVVPSTTARAAILFPIVLLIAETYQVKEGNRNMGKLLAIQSLQANNISTSSIVTATAPQIMAIGFIKDLTGQSVSWTQWFFAAAPVALLSLVASYFIGLKLFKPEWNVPSGGSAGGQNGLAKLKDEFQSLGRMKPIEAKALAIFLITVFLWVSDQWHLSLFGMKISLELVAVISATLFFMPYVGILSWKETKIPWDLMIFSCGAYAGGMALDSTEVASWALNSVFKQLGVEGMSFPVLFAVVIFIASFSHMLFTSKTVRTVILIPTIVALAKSAGVNPIALALPAAFTISDSITLPPHCKPNLIFYSTGFFTVLDQLWYGILVLLVKWGLLCLASFTLYRFLGMNP